MSEEAMREEVAQAVEVAANKAAEEEISKLTEFESAIDETRWGPQDCSVVLQRLCRFVKPGFIVRSQESS